MLAKSIAALVIIVSLSSGWLYFLYMLSGPDIRIQFPTDLEQLIKLKKVLDEYAEVKVIYTLVFFSSAYLYKQSFAIPGSVFLNLLSGALFGMVKGFLLCCTLSACGASMCFLLSKTFGKEILLRYAPDRVKYFQDLVEKSQEEKGLFKFLLSLRVFPMSPNWLINMSSPIVGVPLGTFFLSVLLGLAPYNFLTCHAGSTLADLKSLDDVMSWRVLIGLGILAIGILNPAKLVKKLFRS